MTKISLKFASVFKDIYNKPHAHLEVGNTVLIKSSECDGLIVSYMEDFKFLSWGTSDDSDKYFKILNKAVADRINAINSVMGFDIPVIRWSKGEPYIIDVNQNKIQLEKDVDYELTILKELSST